MKLNIEKSVFVGAGFMDSQLLYMIPIIHGYCKNEKVKKIIFDRPLSKKVSENNIIRKILEKYNIIELNYSSHFRFKILLMVLSNLPNSIGATYQVIKTGILKYDNWYNYQLRHSIWDQARQETKDGVIKMSIYRLFKSSIIVYVAVQKIQKILLKERIVAAFLGHKVYAGRAMKAEFEKKRITVFTHGNEVIYREKNNKQGDTPEITTQKANILLNYFTDTKVEKHWFKRKSGISRNEESRNASKGKITYNLSVPKNVIFLHVFRDSPFFFLDRTRIFSDYVEWIIETLKIISSSNEKWLIKSHPSAAKWGENQKIWFRSIKKYVFGEENLPKNIELSFNKYSNTDLFNNSNRIVTYNGTCHLEAACFGIRPIVINDVTLSYVDKSLTLKPKTYKEYKDFLLNSSKNDIFKLSAKDSIKAKKILLAKEDFLTLAEDVDFKFVERGDTKKLFQENFKLIENRIEKFNTGLSLQGQSLAEGMSQTVSQKFFDFWKIHQI